ncbi:MAG: sensor histidine kinase [Candidatus Azobacteroides sp.]|nr:sensor histidine kinase [Candidatus Azobacteroides sp.]
MKKEQQAKLIMKKNSKQNFLIIFLWTIIAMGCHFAEKQKNNPTDRYTSQDNSYEIFLEKPFNSQESELSILNKNNSKIRDLERQKRFISVFAVGAGTLLLSLLVFSIIRNRLIIGKQKIAEQQILQLEQERQLAIAYSLIDGEMSERTRLARDLHDGLGGMLSIVKLNLSDAEHLPYARGMLDQAISELRRITHHLAPESLSRYGLRVSLEDFCLSVPHTRFHYFGDDSRLNNKIEILLYRCVHELVNNALKHADATAINVQLIQDKTWVSLTIQDNGKGFDSRSPVQGMGIENLRNRIAAYKGKVNIYSSPGKGTEVYMEVLLN